ncbi:MAG: type II toxin-antitoxin system HicA family toxin [Acidobacteria bacterium]|nr:MAG: type II toxin-antitoxin system HicA family toxin [Acidobacteriota bacterium]
MPRLAPVSWHGPLVGGKHPYMLRGDVVVTLPNPHERDISVDLLRRILRNAGITPKEWLSER